MPGGAATTTEARMSRMLGPDVAKNQKRRILAHHRQEADLGTHRERLHLGAAQVDEVLLPLVEERELGVDRAADEVRLDVLVVPRHEEQTVARRERQTLEVCKQAHLPWDIAPEAVAMKHESLEVDCIPDRSGNFRLQMHK